MTLTSNFEAVSVIENGISAPVDGELVVGTSEGDFVEGGAGNDTVQGLAGDDWITGGFGGDDVLTGGEGRDSFYVEIGNGITGGNDTITDFSPDDIVYFFNTGAEPLSFDIVYDGNDTLVIIGAGTPEQSTVRLVNYIAGPFADDVVVDYSFGFSATPYGVVSNDTIVGTEVESEFLEGFAGDDLLIGVGGGDDLNGGLGNDTLIASDAGSDHLVGGAGDDVLIGGAGNESFDDFGGDDLYTGNGGADYYTFYLNHGNDTITDFGEGDTLQIFDSHSGVFSISAEYTDTDTILTINGGTEQESTITLESYILPTYGLPEDGFASLRFSFWGSDFNVVSDDVLFSSSDNGFVVAGGAGNDVLVGSDGFDYLYGGVGDDTILGGATADLINGGEGDDVLQGGAGADTFEFFVHVDETVATGFGSDTISDFEGGDGITITVDGADASNFNITTDGTDSVLTVGVGTDAQSQIQFDDYALSADEISVVGNQLFVTAEYDYF